MLEEQLRHRRQVTAQHFRGNERVLEAHTLLRLLPRGIFDLSRANHMLQKPLQHIRLPEVVNQLLVLRLAFLDDVGIVKHLLHRHTRLVQESIERRRARYTEAPLHMSATSRTPAIATHKHGCAVGAGQPSPTGHVCMHVCVLPFVLSCWAGTRPPVSEPRVGDVHLRGQAVPCALPASTPTHAGQTHEQTTC